MSTIDESALNRIDEHWAVMAVGTSRRDRALEVAKVRLVQAAVGAQMTIDFAQQPEDTSLVERVATAYEVAAAEGIEALLHPSENEQNAVLRLQAQAGAFRAYELRRTLPIPPGDQDRVFHVLHLAALAYCGDRWTDLRRWLRDCRDAVTPPSVAGATWDRRVLFRLFDCWVRLLRKNSWDDLDAVRDIVAGLRRDQRQYESGVLSTGDDAHSRSMAYRLVGLYHWAKATELLAVYVLQGEPASVATELDQHFEAGRQAAMASQDAAFDVLLRWLHVAARRMVAGSLWWVAQAVNSRVSRFVKSVSRRGLFELLPPQRAALLEQGLLDQASRAIVVDLPTSGGKTALAQFRILQALNQFDADQGWVAYVAPTRALVAQVTRRLREDFSPLGVHVEQLTGAIEVDAFEEAMLATQGQQAPFHVLVSTPEKMQLVIRNNSVPRPLALVVMDEAHNIEDEERGLRIELLLATIKRDCATASFLLLTPYVPNAAELARWLGGDAGKTISMGTTAWQPNERIVGMFSVLSDDSVRGGWSLEFRTLTTSPRTITLRGKHQVGPIKPLAVPFSRARNSLSIQAGAMAKVMSERGTSIAVAQKIPDVWSMAREVARNLPLDRDVPAEISLVQRFLQTEISPDFELVNMLARGVAVHHAGLSDETRALIEWLTEIGRLRVLCATTTIAQGINFPVASVFMATRLYPYGKEMPKRAFWNLAGRAGRIDQESVGVVGLAAGKDPGAIRKYVSDATGDLISRLVRLLDDVERTGRLHEMALVIQEPQWSDFRCYVAHLWSEKKNLDSVLAETEQVLRNTLGFGALQAKGGGGGRRKAQALLDATVAYARRLAAHPENATLADATGFAPEGVAQAVVGLNQLSRKLTPDDWQPSSLFGAAGTSSLPHLIGILLRIPEIGGSLKEIGSQGLTERRIADMTRAWVMGRSIKQIAHEFFGGKGSSTAAITEACKAIYRVLTTSGPWGISALSKMPTSGIDFENLTPEAKRAINMLPAMIYHGVQSESAVLMRMNSVPRSIAERVGQEFLARSSAAAPGQTVGVARDFLRSLAADDWGRLVPRGAAMSGRDYRDVWLRLSGEQTTT